MLFIQLGDLHMLVYFGVVHSIAVPILAGTSFLDRFGKRNFPDGTRHRLYPYPILHVVDAFKIHSTVGFAGYFTERIRRRNE